MAKKVIHYAGSMRISRKRSFTRILGGWAACCSGWKAEEIARVGNHSWDKAEVTCRRCLAQIKAEDEGNARLSSEKPADGTQGPKAVSDLFKF